MYQILKKFIPKRTLLVLILIFIGNSTFGMAPLPHERRERSTMSKIMPIEVIIVLASMWSASDRKEEIKSAGLTQALIGCSALLPIISSDSSESDSPYISASLTFGLGFLAIANYNLHHTEELSWDQAFSNNFLAFNVLLGAAYLAKPKRKKRPWPSDCQQQDCQQQNWRQQQQSNLDLYLIPDGIAFNYQF